MSDFDIESYEFVEDAYCEVRDDHLLIDGHVYKKDAIAIAKYYGLITNNEKAEQ